MASDQPRLGFWAFLTLCEKVPYGRLTAAKWGRLLELRQDAEDEYYASLGEPIVTEHIVAMPALPRRPPSVEELELKLGPPAEEAAKAGAGSPSRGPRGPEPKEIPKAAFNKASDLLGQGLSLEKTAKQTGLSVRQVRKIQSVRLRTGYDVKPGRIPTTVVLQKP